MIDKTLEDGNCDIDLVIPWCINVKISLANIHKLPHYQLAIGPKPKLPLLHNAKALALTSIPINKIVIKNLQAIHCTKKAVLLKVQKNCEGPYHTTSEHQVTLNTLPVIQSITNQPKYLDRTDKFYQSIFKPTSTDV